MHEPEVPAWVSTFIKRRRKGGIAMTPEERKETGLRLGKVIQEFFEGEPVGTNQEAVEIVGIALMFYHAFVYAMTPKK